MRSIPLLVIAILLSTITNAQLTKKQLLGTWYYNSMMNNNDLVWKTDDPMYGVDYALKMYKKENGASTREDTLRITAKILAVHNDLVKHYFTFKRNGQYECLRFMHINKVDTVGMEYGRYRIEGNQLVLITEYGSETKQECFRVNDALFIKTEEGVTAVLKK